MQDIKTQWDASVSLKQPREPLDPELRKEFYDRARHTIEFFAFHVSTPSSVVSSEMRSTFFNCGVRGQPFPVISTTGVKSALDVRISNSVLSAFLPGLPAYPEELLECSKSMVATLQKGGMLMAATFTDVFKELQRRPLSEKEMTACLSWWIAAQSTYGASNYRQQLLDAAVFTVDSSDGGGRRIPLKGIQTFLDPSKLVIPLDGPLPDHLLPISVNWMLNSIQLQRSLRWREFTVLEWVQHIVDPAVFTRTNKFNIVESPVWADRVLRVLGGCWRSLPKASKITIVGLLEKLTCIPTSAGMKTPSQAHFSSANIFRDLPVVNLPSKAKIEGDLGVMLADLGVRRHVDLQIIIDR